MCCIKLWILTLSGVLPSSCLCHLLFLAMPHILLWSKNMEMNVNQRREFYFIGDCVTHKDQRPEGSLNVQ